MLRRPPRVLVVNGGSSSGKSALARRLQDELDGYWLRLGVDTLIAAAPPRLLGTGGLVLGDDGSVAVGADFATVEQQWRAGVAATARAGGRVLVEDNFVSGPISQQRWREALVGLPVGWIGVRCAGAVAAAREAARPDRVDGMAARQADAVHRGISYDLELDSATSDPGALARRVRVHFFG